MNQPTKSGYYWVKHPRYNFNQIVEVYSKNERLLVLRFGENVPSEINRFTKYFKIEWLEPVTPPKWPIEAIDTDGVMRLVDTKAEYKIAKER